MQETVKVFDKKRKREGKEEEEMRKRIGFF
jgi:hypothetical protein